MEKTFYTASIKSVDEEQRLIEGIATNSRQDRVGDSILPRGGVWSLPLPFMIDHDHRKVVGEVERLDVTDAGIKFWARIKKIAEPGAAKELVDYGWSLIRNRLRSHVSIGFRSLEDEPLPGGGRLYRRWELLEISAVAVPAHPDAKITGTKATRRVSLSPAIAAAVGRVVRLTPLEMQLAKSAAERREARERRVRLGIPEPHVRVRLDGPARKRSRVVRLDTRPGGRRSRVVRLDTRPGGRRK